MAQPVLPRYARMTRQIEALIAGAYRRHQHEAGQAPLGALFRGTVGKDVVSRTWRRCAPTGRPEQPTWPARTGGWSWTDGRAGPADRKATNLSLLVVLGVRRGAEGVAVDPHMAGETEAAWRAVLVDLIAPGLRTPEFLITAARPASSELWRRSGPRCPPSLTVTSMHLLVAPGAARPGLGRYTDLI